MKLFEVLITRLNNHKQATELELLRGNFPDLAAYKLMVGKLKAIDEIHSIFNETLKEGTYEQE